MPGLQRCLDGVHSLVGNIAVCGHGLDQRGLDFAARDPATRDHGADPKSFFVKRLIAAAG